MKDKIISKSQSSNKSLFVAWLCAIVVFVTMSLSLLVFSDHTEYWDKYAKTDFEIVTEQNQQGEDVLVALIDTPEQLAGAFAVATNPSSVVYAAQEGDLQNFFKQTTNKTFKVTAPLDLSGYTWSSPDLKSGYTIDGGSFVIHGLKVSSSKEIAGFVGTNSGTIKNVILKDATIGYSSSYSGNAQAGGIAGANAGTIENCEVSGTVSGPSGATTRVIGGIAGRQNSGKIKFCFNKATVSAGSHIGGIVGYVAAGTINLCQNFGTVSTNSTGCVREGGIAGEITASVTFSQCYNEGTVYGYNSNGSSDSAVGGIVGYCYAVVDQCYNKGTIKNGYARSGRESEAGKSLTAYTGGIVGITSASVKNCGNAGTVIGGSIYRTGSKSNFTALNSTQTVHFANNVGVFWAYDIYIVGGTYTDSKGSGNYKTSTYTSQQWETFYDNYVGGIVGKSSTSVSSCFNTGTVRTASSCGAYRTQKYTLYFKWKANREHHLLLTESVSFQKNWTIGHIAGSCSSQSGCFFNAANFSNARSISVSQELRNGDKTKTMSISSWTKNSENDSWYLNTLGSADFNTYHNINAKSAGSIIFSAHYKGNVSRDEKTYYTLSTGLSSTTWTESCGSASTNPVVGSNLSTTYWMTRSDVNGGNPMLKCFYFV